MTGPDHTMRVGTAWTLRRERGEGAPEAMYVTECTSCRAVSGWVDNEMTGVAVWALQHTASSGHRRFLHTTQVHWRVDPTPPPGANPTPRRAPRPHGAGRKATAHHAPTPRPAHPAAVWGARCAGPLVITALVTVAALCGYLLGTGITTT